MLYYWWLYSVLAPFVLFDILCRLSPLYLPAWPLGLEHLAQRRYHLGPTTPLYPFLLTPRLN